MSTYLNIFENCFLTKGSMRSTIFDYQREDLYFIENIHYEFLMQCKIQSFSKVRNVFKESLTLTEMNEFIDFCDENELIFWTDTPNYFPQIEIKF